MRVTTTNGGEVLKIELKYAGAFLRFLLNIYIII